MNRISCDVVKDLLPLYVDGAVSQDSHSLVEEHLETCESCRKEYDAMRGPLESTSTSESDPIRLDSMPSSNYDETSPLRGIRKLLRKRRARTILCTIAALLVIASVGYYVAVIPEQYIPYEESGLVVEDSKLYATKNYACSYGFELDESGTRFIALTSNMLSRHTALDKDVSRYEVETFGLEPDEDTYPKVTITEVYYVTEEDFELLHANRGEGMPTDEDEYAQTLKEIKNRATLIWKKE